MSDPFQDGPSERGGGGRGDGDEARARRLEVLFDLGLSVEPGRRREVLASACPEDERLVEEAIRLLAHADGTPEEDVAEAGLAAGAVYGRFRVIAPLRPGGQGLVYTATDAELPGAVLALKVVPLRGLSPSRRQRFEIEAEALVAMRHDNIVRVRGVGVTGDGVGYLAMDLVHDGLPISRFADDAGMGLRERVALVEQVCGGIAHAHANGIAHRDLKPGNILVEAIDGQPRVRIIDFGVAKAMARSTPRARDLASWPVAEQSANRSGEYASPVPDEPDTQRLSPDPAVTQAGDLVGTPGYMSAEQASGLPTDVRSDVYAIGAVLYELVAGHTPFEQALRSAPTRAAIATVLGGARPQPPSRAAMEGRRLAIGRLAAGDVDSIVMKCLALAPADRYQSVSELGADLRRWQEGRPVNARGDETLYVAGKFLRRNAVPVAGAVAILAAGAATPAVWFTAQAARARQQIALERQAAAELRTMFEGLNSGAVADGVRRRLMGELGSTAELELSEVKSSHDCAREFSEAIEWADVTGIVRAELAETIVLPAAQAKLHELELATPTFLERFGPFLETLNALEAHAETAMLLEPLLAQAKQRLGEEHPTTVQLQSDLGAALAMDTATLDEAEAHLRSAAEAKARGLGESDPSTVESQVSLLDVLRRRGDIAAMKECRERVEPSIRVAFGPADSRRVSALSNVALARYVERQSDSLATATALLEEAVALADAFPGQESNRRRVLPSKINLGLMLAEARRFDEAIALLRRTVAECERHLSDRDELTISALLQLGFVLGQANLSAGGAADGPALQESVAALELAVERSTRRWGPGRGLRSAALEALATAYYRSDRKAEAMRTMSRAVDQLRPEDSQDSATVQVMHLKHSVMLTAGGACEEAAERLARRLAQAPADSVEARRFVVRARVRLAIALACQRRFEEAGMALEDAMRSAMVDYATIGRVHVEFVLQALDEVFGPWQRAEGEDRPAEVRRAIEGLMTPQAGVEDMDRGSTKGPNRDR